MTTPEPPYAPIEPPFRRYTNTHDSIGGADLTTPEEEICSRNALARTMRTAPATANNIANWNSVVAVATDGTPITRDKLNVCYATFPYSSERSSRFAGARGPWLPHPPPDHRGSATTSRSPRPRLIAFATLSQSVRTVSHLDLSRLDRTMGLRRSWQEVVQSVEEASN
jgi:hypothetical protein